MSLFHSDLVVTRLSSISLRVDSTLEISRSYDCSNRSTCRMAACVAYWTPRFCSALLNCSFGDSEAPAPAAHTSPPSLIKAAMMFRLSVRHIDSIRSSSAST